MTTPITIVDGTPDLPPDADAWLDQLPGPVAIAASGRDSSRTRVVSGMLHGNEPSGLRAIFGALRSGELFATDTLFFVGAVDAARAAPRHSHRMLPGRRDLNRCFRPPFADVDADRHNVQRLPAGTRLAWLREGAPWPFEALDAAGIDLAHDLFERQGYAIVTRRPIMPIMMTTNVVIAHADCLFYVVEEAENRRAR
jgi:hypothetical protein